MNLRRGFRRITLVLAAVIAISCAFCTVVFVLDEHDSAQSYLRWKEGQYRENYGALPPKDFVIDEPKKEGERKSSWMPKSAVLIKEPQQIAEEELRELKNSFWVNLSKLGLVGLCIVAGLSGAAVGFFVPWVVIWFFGLAIYELIKWIVLGFYDSEGRNVPTKSKETKG